MKLAIVVFLSIATAISASTTFSYFDNFPALVAARRGPPLADQMLLLLKILFLSAPVILIAAVISPIRMLIVASSAHAAIFFTLLTITTVTFRERHGTFGDSVAPMILTALWLILVVEFVMVFAALGRSREVGSATAFLFTFAGLTGPLVGGWVLGVLIWSERLPAKVIESAEATAGSRPYCVEVVGKPVDSRRDLIARSMLAPNNGGYPSDFHAVMAIGSGPERTYANWSYRQGRFLPVSSRVGNNLDRFVKCVPTEHFLLKL